jgi:uncharacterized membrane protein (DUF4010 family)
MMTFVNHLPHDLVNFLLVTLFSLLIGVEQRRHHLDESEEEKLEFLFGTDRTFTLIGILGFILYIISPGSFVPFLSGIIILSMFLGIYYLNKIRFRKHFGLTSIIIALITYCLTPLIYLQPAWLVMLIVVTVLIFVEIKENLFIISKKFGRDEFTTLAKFIIIAGVILPLLPHHPVSNQVNISPYQFWLAIVGTFITRSGIIDSVHAFAVSNIGPLFLAFIILTFIAYLLLLWYRLPELQSDAELDSLLSREAAFLYVNVLFVVAAFVTLFGTLFPIISEAASGTKIAVNAPYFNKVDGPIFLGILLLMGIGPLLGWRRSSPAGLRKSLGPPVALAIAVAVVEFMFVSRKWTPVLAWSAAALVLGTILWEYYRGARARHKATGESWPLALGRVMARNQRRYGGCIVHLGVVMISVGIVGATGPCDQREAQKQREWNTRTSKHRNFPPCGGSPVHAIN